MNFPRHAPAAASDATIDSRPEFSLRESDVKTPATPLLERDNEVVLGIPDTPSQYEYTTSPSTGPDPGEKECLVQIILTPKSDRFNREIPETPSRYEDAIMEVSPIEELIPVREGEMTAHKSRSRKTTPVQDVANSEAVPASMQFETPSKGAGILSTEELAFVNSKEGPMPPMIIGERVAFQHVLNTKEGNPNKAADLHGNNSSQEHHADIQSSNGASATESTMDQDLSNSSIRSETTQANDDSTQLAPISQTASDSTMLQDKPPTYVFSELLASQIAAKSETFSTPEPLVKPLPSTPEQKRLRAAHAHHATVTAKLNELENKRAALLRAFSLRLSPNILKSIPSAQPKVQIYKPSTLAHTTPSPQTIKPEDDEKVTAEAKKVIKEHIGRLHTYNEIRDIGQGLIGMIADQRGVRIVDCQEEFGVSTGD